MRLRSRGVLEKSKATNAWQKRHLGALRTSGFLTTVYRQMYQPMAAKVTPHKVIKVLSEAGVVGLLLGAHGIGAYRSEPRATQDIDMLIKRKDHAKAVRVIRQAYPKLEIRDGQALTRFIDPHNGRPVIDLMKPAAALLKVAFRFSRAIAKTHRVPGLELALATKFAAMVSPNREQSKKHLDASDIVDMVMENLPDIDEEKLKALAHKVYSRGAVKIIEIIRDVKADRPIRI